MTITAEVKGCTISLRQPPLAGGTVGDVTVEFHFDEVWNGYTRTAVFRAHGKTVLMLLASDRCTLPPEATAGGDVLLGVFGVCTQKTNIGGGIFFAASDEIGFLACAEAASRRKKINAFERIGLAGGIFAAEQIHAVGKFQGLRRKIAEIFDFKRL